MDRPLLKPHFEEVLGIEGTNLEIDPPIVDDPTLDEYFECSGIDPSKNLEFFNRFVIRFYVDAGYTLICFESHKKNTELLTNSYFFSKGRNKFISTRISRLKNSVIGRVHYC